MKISQGKYKGRKIITENYKNTRPTMSLIKESIFNMIDVENKNILDIFSGTGQLGFEALSLGAKLVVLIDKDRSVIKNIWKTIKEIEIENIEVYNTNFLVAIKKENRKFDYIFVDPPYENKEYYKQAFDEIRINSILEKEGIIISEINEKSMPVKYYQDNFKLIKEKRYGTTTIVFLKNK